MANHAHSTRTPLLPPPEAVPPLLPVGLGRQPGPVTVAIRAMRAADSDTAADDAIEAIRQGLDRYFSETDRQRVRELRRCIADRIEADMAALDALGGDADFEPSLGAPNPFSAGPADDWAAGSTDDREEENEHGGDVQDEPHDPEEDKGACIDEGVFAVADCDSVAESSHRDGQ